MTSSIPRLVLLTTGLALGVGLAQPAPLKAAVVAYTFDILIDSGPLQPNSYSGSFAYDTNTFNLTSFSFNFEGTQYDETDDPDASAVFDNGVFLGLEYSVGSFPQFSFVPGFFDASDASFTYDLDAAAARGGAGFLTYTRIGRPDVSAVPGPLPLLGAAACFGYSRRLRQRMKISIAPGSSQSPVD